MGNPFCTLVVGAGAGGCSVAVGSGVGAWTCQASWDGNLRRRSDTTGADLATIGAGPVVVGAGPVVSSGGSRVRDPESLAVSTMLDGASGAGEVCWGPVPHRTAACATGGLTVSL